MSSTCSVAPLCPLAMSQQPLISRCSLSLQKCKSLKCRESTIPVDSDSDSNGDYNNGYSEVKTVTLYNSNNTVNSESNTLWNDMCWQHDQYDHVQQQQQQRQRWPQPVSKLNNTFIPDKALTIRQAWDVSSVLFDSLESKARTSSTTFKTVPDSIDFISLHWCTGKLMHWCVRPISNSKINVPHWSS
jgi:hypothetical protein